MHRITQLYIYPIKSLAGIEVTKTALDTTGLQYDRRWMLVDAQNRFISQREFHLLCLFQTALTPTGIRVEYNGDSIEIPLCIADGNIVTVTIWDDTVKAISAHHIINEWFSTQLGQAVTLVYMPGDTRRSVDPAYAIQDAMVSFADGYPLLCIGEQSLQLLQSKIPERMSMSRFRPNIVFSGGAAHCEDSWTTFYINQLRFKGVKPCGRCVITTIDPDTGKAAAEPLRTLATYRNQHNKILFGQNVLAPTQGTIEVGMEIYF
jgi:uncharacterized protein YcbX